MCTLRRCHPARNAVNDCSKNQFRNLLLLLQTHVRLSGRATFSGFHVYHHVYRVWCVILDEIVDLSRMVTEHVGPLCIGTSMSTGLILGPVEYHPTIFSLAANHPFSQRVVTTACAHLQPWRTCCTWFPENHGPRTKFPYVYHPHQMVLHAHSKSQLMGGAGPPGGTNQQSCW